MQHQIFLRNPAANAEQLASLIDVDNVVKAGIRKAITRQPPPPDPPPSSRRPPKSKRAKVEDD